MITSQGPETSSSTRDWVSRGDVETKSMVSRKQRLPVVHSCESSSARGTASNLYTPSDTPYRQENHGAAGEGDLVVVTLQRV